MAERASPLICPLWTNLHRDTYLKKLDYFYKAIEDAAHHLNDFTEKQRVLNSVYERFFQGYAVKVTDTHGIVYTPQEIVNFMCASVVEVLQTEFGKSLGDEDVYLIDPATGTGNFVVNLLHRLSGHDLPALYGQVTGTSESAGHLATSRLFANEIMLLPYYRSVKQSTNGSAIPNGLFCAATIFTLMRQISARHYTAHLPSVITTSIERSTNTFEMRPEWGSDLTISVPYATILNDRCSPWSRRTDLRHPLPARVFAMGPQRVKGGNPWIRDTF